MTIMTINQKIEPKINFQSIQKSTDRDVYDQMLDEEIANQIARICYAKEMASRHPLVKHNR